jgi:hypothetical protein
MELIGGVQELWLALPCFPVLFELTSSYFAHMQAIRVKAPWGAVLGNGRFDTRRRIHCACEPCAGLHHFTPIEFVQHCGDDMLEPATSIVLQGEPPADRACSCSLPQLHGALGLWPAQPRLPLLCRLQHQPAAAAESDQQPATGA